MQVQRLLKIGFLCCTAAAFLILAGCSTFNGDLETELGVPEITYISPENKDGIQDSFEVPVELPGYENLAIHSYAFEVKDENNAVVFSLKDEVVKRRRRSGLNFPSFFGWDGKNNEGDYLPEGEYSYTVKAEYGKDRKYQSDKLFVVIDNTPPSLELSSPYPLFSPNNDGRVDTVRIMQRKSTWEDQWSGEVLDAAGIQIKTLMWKGLARDFDWDGAGDNGKTAADGVYSYKVSSTDRAGNSGEFILQNIKVDTTAPSVTLDISETHFSPNGDGIKDAVEILPALSNIENLVSWEISINNSLGAAVRTFTGLTELPGSIVFDGKDAAGSLLSDGIYKARILAGYKNGNEEERVSSLFYLDNTSPYSRVNLEYPLFSPNGDGRKDDLIINQSTSVETRWEGAVIDSAGRRIRSYVWNERAIQVKWDGRDEEGKVVSDGFYTYRLTSVDEAGNVGEREVKNIRLIAAKPVISITVPQPGASPNSDGIDDIITLNCKSSMPNEIETWDIGIFDSKGNKIKSFAQNPGAAVVLPPVLTWDGKQDSGAVVEGEYFAQLNITFEKGDYISSRNPGTFQIDVTGPNLNINVVPRPFSPDNDGVDDSLMINLSAADISGMETWNVTIYDPVNHEFIGFSGREQPKSSIPWDGRSARGLLVESASDYRAVFSAEDKLGNTAKTDTLIPVDILVLKDGENLKIVISSIYFVPYTADYYSIALEKEKVQKNIETLDKLAVVLKKYGQYRIRLEGHAVREYWDDPARVIIEENEELQPLSAKRAEAIKQALEKRGIDPGRMTTAGFGGNRPVVPHSDLDNRWKNRRVEFILIKK